jgi:hypothetical protein
VLHFGTKAGLADQPAATLAGNLLQSFDWFPPSGARGYGTLKAPSAFLDFVRLCPPDMADSALEAVRRLAPLVVRLKAAAALGTCCDLKRL